MTARGILLASVLVAVTSGARPATQEAITSPHQQFGANIGDDYFLATLTQFEQYWRRLDAESDRVQVVSIGRTEEGRDQLMAIVSAPENLARIDRYRDISRRLALGEPASDAEAQELAAAGKTVVLVAGGLHADEVLGVQQLIETVYQLAIGSDAETLRILRDVIVLALHANPDGHALVADWYMREPDPRRRTFSGLPRLYQKYVGHDINRDFFLSSQAETININRVLNRQWFPQIVYDHHQPAPSGAVMFVPPFGTPSNPLFDALILPGIELLGAAMQERLGAEGKRGVVTRDAAPYSTWWNGGLRTAPYFHNQLGLLTETIGSPTPINGPLEPQPWRFRQSIEYSVTANRAVLDAASHHRDMWLFNSYRMARNAIARGTSEMPRGYVVPASQPDFPTATRFVDALLKSGVMVERTTTTFAVATRRYPAGSYVIRAAQPFRAHVLDMFEPQHHPDQEVTPYDVTGWTLAFQMGIKFDRLRERVAAAVEPVTAVTPPRAAVTGPPQPGGYLLSHHANDTFRIVNRLLRAGVPVYWPRDRSLGGHDGTGMIYAPATEMSTAIVLEGAHTLGVDATGVAAPPRGEALRVQPVRIALWDRSGGASTSGWIRWILERYDSAFERVDEETLARGMLADRYDAIVLPDEAEREAQRVAPQLRQFAEAGGTLLLIGGATRIAEALGVRATDRIEALTREAFYIPGAVVRVRVDNTLPLAYGFERQVDVMFDSSPAFALATAPDTRRVAWYDAQPLRSGWARGQHHLRGAAAVVESRVGPGRVVLFGPEITFRGQSHGTFKFLFNGIHLARAVPVAPIP